MQSTTSLIGIKTIRWIGILYLAVIICAGFSQGYVRGSIVDYSNPVTTANHVSDAMGLFRLGLVSDLVAFIMDAVISILLYQVFKPYGKTLAMVSSALRLIAHPAIGSLNLLNHYMALEVLGGESFLLSFDRDQLEVLSWMFLEAHRYGYLIAGAFFGVHCVLLGIQIYRSDVFPRFFGGLLLGSGAGYLLETFGNFGFPGHEPMLALIVGVCAALGEVGLTLYILIKGSTKRYKSLLGF